MIDPARVDLRADRWTAFVRTIDVTGLVLTGVHAQIRLRPDADGDPLVELPIVPADTQGIRILSVDSSGGVPVTNLRMQIPLAAMQAMPAASEAGGDLDLAWDLLVNEAGGAPFRLLFGTFTVVAGVTRNG
jgi:hypothetical protein